MAQETVTDLPVVGEFEGLTFSPHTMMVTLRYRPSHAPDRVCQLRFPFATADRLTSWLVDMLERLAGDVEKGERLKAIYLRSAPPQGSA